MGIYSGNLLPEASVHADEPRFTNSTVADLLRRAGQASGGRAGSVGTSPSKGWVAAGARFRSGPGTFTVETVYCVRHEFRRRGDDQQELVES